MQKRPLTVARLSGLGRPTPSARALAQPIPQLLDDCLAPTFRQAVRHQAGSRRATAACLGPRNGSGTTAPAPGWPNLDKARRSKSTFNTTRHPPSSSGPPPTVPAAVHNLLDVHNGPPRTTCRRDPSSRHLPPCTAKWLCTAATSSAWLHESSTTALLATSWQPSAAALRTRLTSSQQAGKPSPATFADVELQSNLGRLSPMALQAPPAASTGSLSWQPAGNPWWPPSSQQTCSPGAPASRTSSSTSLVSPATGLMPRAASTAGQPALGRCPLPKPR